MRRNVIVMLLVDGTVEWHKIGWGKHHLDYIRERGTILMTFVEEG